MKTALFLFVTYAALCIATCRGSNDSGTCSPEENGDITISTKCASVLLVTGTTLGSGVAYALTPVAICAAGFCPAGVAGGSFASWWKSTMPLVAKGSLFAQLQALAMGGVGATAVTVGGGILGGLSGAMYLSDFCAYVDEKDPDSAMGQAFDASEALVQTAIQAKIQVETQCASSSTCNAIAETTSAAMSVVSKQISSWWDSLSTGISNAAALAKLHMDVLRLELNIKAEKEEFGVKTFDFLRQIKKESFSELKLEKMYTLCFDRIHQLESQRDENQFNDGPNYTTRSLQREIENQKTEFGIEVFDYLKSEDNIVVGWKMTELETLAQMFQESSEKVNAIIVLLQEKQSKIDGF
mmetsp:Transcript_14733/g.27988  ORF Transcript_14733/g.27988 Transcript_14733/m.27988 type:complete len:354 (-) Transcript_14733:82-1143(-)